jgi:hypothetical protein
MTGVAVRLSRFVMSQGFLGSEDDTGRPGAQGAAFTESQNLVWLLPFPQVFCCLSMRPRASITLHQYLDLGGSLSTVISSRP